MKRISLPLYIGSFLIVLFSQCASTKEATTTAKEPSPVAYSIQGVLFHQQAAEYDALCYQGYNFARLALASNFTERSGNLPSAVIMDIDETVLDNSYFNAQLILDDSAYSQALWSKWTATEKASPVPGALEFLRFADSLKIRIFYVSNRRTNELNATMNNLKKIGFPQVELSQCLFRGENASSSKEERRLAVAQNYEVLLLVGDNLADFSIAFEQAKTPAERENAVVQLKSWFGDKYIILPNAIYGDWEKALYRNAPTNTEREKVRRTRLKGY
ncbi:MAG: 5'-nucleotidase, lipoprotein e(P4) family [Chitinophagales bacterium]|nr:5'-nucleotidase, lipoprotein e(P4) family [Chitinophagales bacterium]